MEMLVKMAEVLVKIVVMIMMATTAFRRHRRRGGEGPPSSSSSLTSSLDGRRVSPLVLGLHGMGGARPPPLEIGYVSLSLSVSAFPDLAFHRFFYNRRSVTPVGLNV